MSADEPKTSVPPPSARYEPFTPYYLHPSEGTGSVISPILLKGTNYDEWVRSLRLDSKKYRDVAQGLLLLDPLPTVTYAHGKALSAERHQTVTDANDTRTDVVGFAVDGSSSGRNGGSSEPRMCSHCGRKGHEKDKCFELHGWPEWAATGSRGGRSGRHGGRGARGGRTGGGRGRGSFAGAVDSNQRGAAPSASVDVDRNSLPALSDSQFQQLVAALTSSKSTSTVKIYEDGSFSYDNYLHSENNGALYEDNLEYSGTVCGDGQAGHPRDEDTEGLPARPPVGASITEGAGPVAPAEQQPLEQPCVSGQPCTLPPSGLDSRGSSIGVHDSAMAVPLTVDNDTLGREMHDHTLAHIHGYHVDGSRVIVVEPDGDDDDGDDDATYDYAPAA
ncbi:hypothetical protein BVRB_8g195340 [Beta vulgaris subsp. vulgaris]|nr:hypothetical protein BVRB_8g195340 [Beta vulgaris subsp. vulgaris]